MTPSVVDEVARERIEALDRRVDVRIIAAERAVDAAEELMDARLIAIDKLVDKMGLAILALEQAKSNRDGRTAAYAAVVSGATSAVVAALSHWLGK